MVSVIRNDGFSKEQSLCTSSVDGFAADDYLSDAGIVLGQSEHLLSMGNG